MKLLLIGIIVFMASCAKRTYTYTVRVVLKDSLVYTAELERTKRTEPKMELKNGCFFFDGDKLVCGASSYMIIEMERYRMRKVRY